MLKTIVFSSALTLLTTVICQHGQSSEIPPGFIPMAGYVAVGPAADENAAVEDDADTNSGSFFVPREVAQVRTELLQWIAESGVSNDATEQLVRRWADDAVLQSMDASEVLNQVVETIGAVDETAADMLYRCRAGVIPDAPVYDGIRERNIYETSLRLYHARWLSQHRFVDEALEVLAPVRPEETIDPATYFFVSAVCHAQLLHRAQAQDSIDLLLHNTVGVSERYRIVAELLQEELKLQQDESMDEVTRRMADVHRRLDLGRSGEKVQEQEDEVVALLDRMLEAMEQQQQQQQQGASSSSSGGRSNQPAGGAPDSMIKGTAEAGEADRKELTERGSWGMLNPKAEAKTRELIREQFPSNYLDAISTYTRKLAESKK